MIPPGLDPGPFLMFVSDQRCVMFADMDVFAEGLRGLGNSLWGYTRHCYNEGTGLTQKRFPKFVQFLAMLLPQPLQLLPERFTGALLQDELGPVGPTMRRTI